LKLIFHPWKEPEVRKVKVSVGATSAPSAVKRKFTAKNGL
jgi:hypothetical protein